MEIRQLRFAGNDTLQAALQLLREAKSHCRDAGLEAWQFATSLTALRATGISDSAIRWLIHSGFVRHAVEYTRCRDTTRVFRHTRNLALFPRSCFVLTARGCAIRGDAMTNGRRATAAERLQRESEKASTPVWDQSLHTLYWNGRVLKHFKSEAPNQEALLREFEAARWPPCVSARSFDQFGVRTKERLHESIKSLNRNVGFCLRFTQEGNGTRICWQPASRTLRHPQRTPNAPLDRRIG
jgi:hypothetical protein